MKGYQYIDFEFYASAGQILYVDLNDDIEGNKNTLDVLLFHRAFNHSVHLPSQMDTGFSMSLNGTYILRILQMRTFARRGHTNAFVLTLTLN
ncbi:hypothetical protein A8L45_05300 [Veronia pacifica]|uniref:Peptidase C-terminal archaeal/bacterial domain-containing protein n=1 Tax=Veronia pacifica TaxID=1080227 RepID=A0A1C3EPC0_9GAMM|nr:hypothetical protein A8L45_05300 [Veronia pacifica]